MKNKVLIFVLGSAAAVAALAVYGYKHLDDFLLEDEDCDGDCDNCECASCPGCDACFEDEEIADKFDEDDGDVACLGNCEECDLCSNGAASVIPDVSGISAGLEA